MAVLEVKRYDPRSGSDDTITVRYFVRTDGSDSIQQILADSKVPHPGHGHPDDLTWIAQSPRQLDTQDDDKNCTHWDLVVEYKKRASVISLTGDKDRLLNYHTSAQRYQEVMAFAYQKRSDGTWTNEKVAVQTSAGDPFDPPPMKVAVNPVLNWEQREPNGITPLDVIAQLNTINKRQVTILGKTIAPEKAQIINAQTRWSGEEYVTSYQVEIEQEHALLPKIIDQGYRRLNSNGRLVNITKEGIEQGSAVDNPNDNTPVDDPVLLDGSGNIHPDVLNGDLPTYNQYYAIYRGAELSDWNTVLDLIEDAP